MVFFTQLSRGHWCKWEKKYNRKTLSFEGKWAPEWQLLTLEDPSLNPVQITFTEYLFSNCIEKTKINQPRPGASPIKILQQKKIGYVNFLSFLIG